ncbi:unnamed protein product [Vicia faba]|uniref:Integrase catalytic domain-containing protein n=1 Tax=Vicia faba TaxID=3906 RepID=A0AAV0ZXT5_VICFA|nr:unnamed protein product [Vicia faba]
MDFIWVVYDRLTKFSHFKALPTKFSAKYLDLDFSIEICHLHGVPTSIVSYRDPLFLNIFRKELFRAQGTTLKYYSAYHLETDGETEVVNHCLKTYLRCFISDNLKAFRGKDLSTHFTLIPTDLEGSEDETNSLTRSHASPS